MVLLRNFKLYKILALKLKGYYSAPLILMWMILGSTEIAGANPSFKADATTYVKNLKQLTDLMVQDVTGPCAAARYYTYANLVAYEIIYQQQKPENYIPLSISLKDYPKFKIKSSSNIDVNLAVLYGVLRIGEELLPSGKSLEQSHQQLIREAFKKHRLKKNVIEETIAYTEELIKTMVEYAHNDGYFKTSGYIKYTPLKDPGSWQPTPPGYMEAYEPHWDKVRPFLLDSASQFKPVPAISYSEKPGSLFLNLANEVYESTNNLSEEQKLIANYWDCNPFFLTQKGHISFGTKKISPGAHWMGITGIIASQKQVDIAETIRWHTLVSITMADAFLSCWQEKYISNRIRPETFINKNIDREWRPLLQTPPFPEYTSGHSVVSSSVAIILTELAGDDVAFIDTVEVEFGLPARSFSSFKQAAHEAAISRFYGGIHFMDAIENGFTQGEQIGKFIAQKLKL